MFFSCFVKQSYNTSSGAKGGDDECEECEQKWRGGRKVGYVHLEKRSVTQTIKTKRHRFIELVGEENQEDEKRNNEEAVTQSGVGWGSSLVGIHVRHPQQDAREDDGVEDAHQGDAEDDPEGDEGDLPGPGDDAVQLEREEDKLEDVDGAEEFKFKGAIMANGPHTDGNGDHADENQRDKHKDPHVPEIRKVGMIMWTMLMVTIKMTFF